VQSIILMISTIFHVCFIFLKLSTYTIIKYISKNTHYQPVNQNDLYQRGTHSIYVSPAQNVLSTLSLSFRIIFRLLTRYIILCNILISYYPVFILVHVILSRYRRYSTLLATHSLYCYINIRRRYLCC